LTCFTEAGTSKLEIRLILSLSTSNPFQTPYDLTQSLLGPEVTLFPNQDKIHFFTSFNTLDKLARPTSNEEQKKTDIVHKPLHKIITIIRAYSHHASVKWEGALHNLKGIISWANVLDRLARVVFPWSSR